MEKFIKKRIFGPSDMDHIFSSISSIKDTINLATSPSNGDRYDKNPYLILMIGYGAARGIYLSFYDLCNRMLLHLNKSKYGKNLEKIFLRKPPP
ncbi:MAG: hypothetical protein GXO86_02210 [Chlorobi bacterium]|nr:hypothetical protein [Chlorobiota bacterium]